jgi:hypothetical protein
MKTNKGLQIGNLLYNHRRWACPILEIGADRVTVIARHYGEETFLLEDMREIELSEDLIPKLGFEKENQENCHFDHYWELNKFEEQDEEDPEDDVPELLHKIKLFQSIYKGYWVEIYNYITGAKFLGQVEFLHQLQNACDQCEVPFNINKREITDKL